MSYCETSKLFDVTATKDWTNCKARADVVVDGQTLLAQVPATYLLFLEKQLVDVHTFVRKLPVLGASEAWSFDPSADCWATEQHPAQVEVYYEDVIVGYWRTVKFSGALPAQRVNELLARVEKLQEAVKYAREEANNIEADEQRVGERVFGYLFA